ELGLSLRESKSRRRELEIVE
ncbi:hypothetical protein CCACVL1_08197, partial [Corchorus capsularis]